MKLFLLAALSLFALSTAAKVPTKICFKKTTTCCFTFSQCGTVVKKIPTTKQCPFKKCKTLCKPHCVKACTIEKKKVPTEECTTIPAGCKEVWGKKKCHKAKKVCKTVYKIVKNKVCKDKCEKKCVEKCHIIKATCTTITTIKFPKFCPKLSCSAPVITGPNKKPAPVVSKVPSSKHVSKPVRKIIGKIHK